MRKLMVMTAMLALMLAAAAPAFASEAVGGDVNVRFVNASQSQAAFALQTNEGDIEAEARGLGSAADASIEQDLWIEQSQTNAGLGGFSSFSGGGDLDLDGLLDVVDADDDNDGIHDDFEFIF